METILRDRAAAGTLRAFVEDPLTRRDARLLASGLRDIESDYHTEEYAAKAAELGLCLPERV